MSNMLNVTSSPHVRDKMSTRTIMQCVILALMPASIFGVYNFGWYALFLICITIATTVCSEWLYNKITHHKNTTGDYSAVLTGLLLTLNLPPTLPWFEAVIGGLFAIFVVKMVFGGLGQNFMNPALGARCFLLISFAGDMTKFAFDGQTGATPLAIIKSGNGSVNLLSMFLGRIGGTIGETSTLCLLIGAVFLIAMKIIDWRIPLVYIATFSVFALLFGKHGFDLLFLAEEICGGGIILGAFFMATDYVTSPVTPMGRIVFGVVLGIFTGLFRFYGSNAEGVSYAIILSNLLVPLIERWTVPMAFGQVKEKKGGAQ